VLAALEAGATCVVPVIPVSDSLRGVAPGGTNAPLDRAGVRLVQTPQGFTLEALRRGHAGARTDGATDDATLVEATGESVTLVDGDPLAFKITTPLDLLLAEAVLAR
jgi:2-C-methyl-D-erythritol 4-phosphate cytidylyltransferase